MMATAKRKKASALPASIRGKSSMDTLLDTMRGIIDDGARRMTPKELEESEKKFNAALDHAVASRKRRRETA
jgi:DNA transposition AAA+ family ATPase